MGNDLSKEVLSAFSHMVGKEMVTPNNNEFIAPINQFEPPNILFSGQWEDAKTSSPKDTKEYLCIVSEVTDLTVYTYHYICNYDSNDKIWETPYTSRVAYWTELPKKPF